MARCITRILPLLTIMALCSPASAEKRPFTIEDLYRLKGVSSPVISPDGKSIVFTVTVSNLKTAKRTTNIWRMDADGANQRQLTFSDTSDSSPAFSPDGKYLAFLSTRSGSQQLHVMPVSGGESEKKTAFPGGISSFVFSPDSRRVAFVADVYPECGADTGCNKRLLDAREKNKIKAHLADGLLFRHWDSWKDGLRSHILLMTLPNEKNEEPLLVDLTPGDFDSPVFSQDGSPLYAFSPDGKEFLFTSNRDQNEALSTNADLFSISLENGSGSARTPTNLTSGNKAWDGAPAFSPDGRFLAYRSQKVPLWESDRFRIVLVDRVTKKSRVLTESFDNTITGLAWGSDSKALYFTAEVKGRTPLYSLNAESGAIVELTATGYLDSFDIAPGGTWAAVARRQIHLPVEIIRVDLTQKNAETRLTKFNEPVENEVDIRPAEEIFVKGADGKPVQVWIVKPHGFDPAKKYPLILNIHGGPQQQWADSFRGDWQVYPGAGYIVAFPNPHGSSGFGEAYTAAISGDWNGKVMVDIERVTDHLSQLPYVDANRMGAMGWSWGGYAIMWLAGNTQRFKAMASMMGVYDLRTMYSTTEELWFPHWDLKGAPWENSAHYAKASPSNYAPNFKTPCLVITGQKDFRIPYSQSLAFFTDLKLRNVPSRLLVFQNAGHWPSWNEMAVYYAAHLEWFQQYLGGGGSTLSTKALVDGTAFEEKSPKE